MTHFGWLDGVAIVFFITAWLGYHAAVEFSRLGGRSLNAIMAQKRRDWLLQTLHRESRVVDAQLINGLQNGTAFFASTSLLAIGAVMTLLRVGDDAFKIYQDLPFGFETTRIAWEIKVLGLALVFAYAFFKFSWSYRLFNYAAILMGAIPPADVRDTKAALEATRQAAEMHVVAGRHFNRGQRAFFFAPAYLCWFIGPLPFIGATAAILFVMWNRQFRSDAYRTLKGSGTAADSPSAPAPSTRAGARKRTESRDGE